MPSISIALLRRLGFALHLAYNFSNPRAHIAPTASFAIRIAEAIEVTFAEPWQVFDPMPFTLHDKLALLTVTEDALWEELIQQSRLQSHLIKVISPRAVLLEPVAVEPLLKTLRKNGHLPRVVV